MELKKGDYVLAKIPRLEDMEIGRVLLVREGHALLSFVLADGSHEEWSFHQDDVEPVTFAPANPVPATVRVKPAKK